MSLKRFKLTKEIQSSLPKVQEAYQTHEFATNTKDVLEQLKNSLMNAKQENQSKVKFDKAIALIDDLIKDTTKTILNIRNSETKSYLSLEQIENMYQRLIPYSQVDSSVKYQHIQNIRKNF